MNQNKLEDHIYATYRWLRIGLIVLALMFPTLLWLIGVGFGVGWQDSMSAYYWTPVHDLFIGILFAVGPYLLLYKGFTPLEGILLNVAGASAICIALFPMECPAGGLCQSFTPHTPAILHYICAGIFFASTALVAWLCASDTLVLIDDPRKVTRYKLQYALSALLMVICPAFAWVLGSIFLMPQYVFMAEAGAITAFAWYWVAKSFELEATRATIIALQKRFPAASLSRGLKNRVLMRLPSKDGGEAASA